MKNLKRVLTLALVVLMMTALLAGCTGNTAQPSASPSAEAKPSAAAPETSETAALPTTEMSEFGAGKLGNGKDIYKEEINIAYIPLSTAGQANMIIDLMFHDVTLIYPNVKVTALTAVRPQQAKLHDHRGGHRRL